MPLAETILATIAQKAFNYALDQGQSKVADWARDKIGLEPRQQAFKRALNKAFKKFEKQYPQWATDLFNASFLEHEGASILAQFLVRDGHLDPSELATQCADSLNILKPERHTTLVRELEPAATDFLDYMTRALKAEPELSDLNDSRALEQLVGSLKAIRQKLDAEQATPGTRRDYLRWLIERNLYLDPRGTFQTQRHVQVKLDEVYIALRAQRNEKPADVDRRILEQELTELEEKIASSNLPTEEAEDQLEQLLVRFRSSGLGVISTESSEVIELAAAVNRHERLVILGDPGSGKTTLLRYLALKHAQTLWDGRFEASADLGTARFPILIRIADYAEKGIWRTKSLSDFLIDYHARHECPKDGLTDLFATELDEGKCLILLDGLDEIVSADDRRAVVRQIEDFVRHYSNTPNRFVITSRIAGYRSAPLGEPFAHYVVQEMDEAQIRRFLERWSIAVEAAQTPDLSLKTQEIKARQEIEGIMKAVQTSPGVRRLAANPLLLRILALIHRTGAQLPQKRIELYKLAADTLARTWRTAQGVPESALIEDEYLTQLLSKLAYWLHVNKPTGIATEREVFEVLGEEWAYINDQPWNTEKPNRGVLDEVKNFLRAVREHTGLFVERAPQRYGFMHLTFEEYYAARYLVAHSKTRIKLIRKHLHDPRWDEPILLALGFVGLDSPKDATGLLETAILAQGEEAQALSLRPTPYEDILGWDYLFALRCLGDQIPANSKLVRQLVERLAKELLYQANSAHFQRYQQTLSERLDHLKTSKAALALAPLLVAALRNVDPKERIQAVGNLGRLGYASSEVVTELLKALRDPDPRVRIQVAESLGRLGYASSEVVTELLKALRDPDPVVRMRAAESLGRMGYQSDKVVALLLKALPMRAVKSSKQELGEGEAVLLSALHHYDPRVRMQAAASLGQLGQVTNKAMSTLLGTLRDPDPRVRVQVAESLERLGYASSEVTDLIEGLHDDRPDHNPRLNLQTIKSSKEAKRTSDNTEAELLGNLWYPDPRMRIQAVEKLGRLGQASDEVKAALFKALQDDNPTVRMRAAESLGQEGYQSDKVIAMLLKALRDADPRVRIQAAESLRRLGQVSSEVITALLDALDNKEYWSVRSDAAFLLGQIGPNDKSMIEALWHGLLDTNDKVRTACAQALAQLGHRFPTIALEIAEKLKQAIKDPEFEKPDFILERSAHEYAFDGLWLLMVGGEIEAT